MILLYRVWKFGGIAW
jgi:hypothetical protein